MVTEESDPDTLPVLNVSPLIIGIRSNEAKLLALERRMAGHDSSRPGSNLAVSSLAGTANFSQFPAGATSQAPITQAKVLLPSSTAPALASSTAPAAAQARAPPATDFSKRRRTGASPERCSISAAADAAGLSSHSRAPLSDITPGAGEGGPLDAVAQPLAMAAGEVLAPAAAPTTQPPVASSAAAGGPSGSGAGRSRKRKQQEPRHDRRSSGGGTRGAVGSTRGPGSPPGSATPKQARGATAEPDGVATAANSDGTMTPQAVVRHLFDEGAVAAAAAAGAGGRCNSGGARGTASVSCGGRPPGGASSLAGPPPSSAQKRSILSYYPPVPTANGVGSGTGGGGVSRNWVSGAGAAASVAAVPLVPDQSSRDGLSPPRSLLQQAAAAAASLQQQQQQLRRQADGDSAVRHQALWSGPGAGAGSGVAARDDGAAAAAAAGLAAGPEAAGSSSAVAVQLQQYQQQVSQLQAQVIQVQAAMAAQHKAAGAEIERLQCELEARSAEVASLQSRCRSQEVALQQALTGEAAAREGLETLQASSASESARWAAEAAEAARVASDREARFQSELARMAQLSARLERELSRSQLSANASRLGSLTLVRTGPMQMAEVWEDGTAFQQLTSRREALKAAREEVLAAQKELRKRLAPPPAGARSAAAAAATVTVLGAGGGGEESTLGGGASLYLSGQEFVAADEVYKMRLAVLKREEEALKEEEERLQREKFKQIRCLKLAREEDASRFGRWPVLPDRPEGGRPRYVLMNLLGKGGFSEVFKAYDLAEARHVCVKIHALTPSWPAAKKESYVKHAIREYDIHRSLRHPAVVGLLDVLEIDLDTFATVLELCEGGDLDGLLREHRTLPEREARCLMAQIFSGLRYLASRRVIHYDLKPANILFDSLGQAKITDFGLSKLVSEGQTLAGIELTSQGAGTYWYLPPEAFEIGGSAPPRISNKLDVWSAGVIFYSILYGKKPYGENMSQEQMLRERVMAVPREVEFPSRPAVSSEAKDFIRRCLAWHQDNRPDVEAAAADPYLTGAAAAAAAAAGGSSSLAATAATGSGVTSLSMGLAAMVGSRR